MDCQTIKIHIYILAWITFIISITTPAIAGTHALLIGITDYRDAGLPSLDGPINDLNLIRTVLLQRLNVPPENIRRLVNEQATHSGIKNAIVKLDNAVKTGDFVYIHYSGHGSLATDVNHDERRGMDQTWVCFNARRSGTKSTPDLNDFDILDDELARWLMPIYLKARYVVIVSDSCHSASVTRGRSPNIRAVSADLRPHPAGTFAMPAIPSDSVLRIGAARDDQSACEFEHEDFQTFGLFTWHWAKALYTAQASDTWEDVFQRTYAHITHQRGVTQQPQKSGAAHRKLFGGNIRTSRKSVSVIDLKDNGRTVYLDAGKLSGVTIGSLFRKKNTTQPNELKISRTKATYSIAKRISGNFEIGDLVIESMHMYPFDPRKVYIDGDFPQHTDKPIIKALSSLVQKNPAYQLTQSQKQCDLILYVLRPKRKKGAFIYKSKSATLPLSSPALPPQVWILSPTEHLLHPDLKIRLQETKSGITHLGETLFKLARTSEIEKLPTSPESTLDLHIQATRFIADATCRRYESDCIEPGPNMGFYRKKGPFTMQDLKHQPSKAGDILTFTLKNISSHSIYTYLLEIQPDGQIEVIFPQLNEMQAQALLQPNEQIDLFTLNLGIKLEQPGKDILRFITTQTPIRTHLLEQSPFGKRSIALDPLETLLANAIHGMRSRTCVRNDAWQSVQYELVVETP